MASSKTVELLPSELLWFQKQAYANNLPYCESFRCSPINSSDSRFVFNLPASSLSFLRTNFKLMIRWNVTQADNTPLTAIDKVSTICLPHYAMQRSVSLKLNEVLVQSVDRYNIQQYVLQTYSTSAESVKYQGSLTGMYLDTAGLFTSFEHNEGLKKRQRLIAFSRKVTTVGAMNYDISRSNRRPIVLLWLRGNRTTMF